jgi:hypothetical protein
MNALKFIARELAGLFIDDKFLALGILIVVGAAWLLRWTGMGAPLAAGAVLLFGCLAVLIISALGEPKK